MIPVMYVLPCRIVSSEGLSYVSFTSSIIFKKLLIKPGTAPGPDGTQATLHKHASNSLALPLAQLFQYQFNASVVPKECKLATRTDPGFLEGATQ